MTTTLVTGPVRSGKSRHAEDLLAQQREVLYLATGAVPGHGADGRPTDAEWADRVREHQVRRPAGWRTVETSDLESAIAAADSPVIVDCLGTWLAAVVDAAGWHDLDAARDVLRERTRSLTDSLVAATAHVVVVTNEVGWSLVPTTESGRFFSDELGRLNAAVAHVSTSVHLVIAGRVLDLSEAPRVPWKARSRTLDA